MPDPAITIVRYTPENLAPPLLAQVEAIFFETATRAFEPGPERETFRERWLGRYLKGGSDVVLLALQGPEAVAGYLVGALENPAEQERFADIAYFRTDFAHLCRRFPAHLHINLTQAFRSRGIGARLVEAFAEHARLAGAAGMHVVTGSAMRNARFYERCGFSPRGTAQRSGGAAVFLGRELDTRA